ncbi:MAG: CRP-like cAMP-binding protein [Alphaproteobacteria bacterium]|jgi:CRP-like cAMP-binding protein
MLIELSTLRALPLFSALSQTESLLIRQNGRLGHCNQMQFLFMHGEEITHFYVICRGTIQIFRETPDGHEVTSNMLIAGDVINANEIMTQESYHNMNARAVDNAILLKIPINWIKAHLNDFEYMSTRLLAGLSDRLHNAQIEAEHQSTMSATQIVACFLQRLCLAYNFNPEGFELPYSKTLIASRLHMELATFSRTLKKLKDEGICVTGTHVSFIDKQKISHFVCDACSLSEECPARIYKNIT